MKKHTLLLLLLAHLPVLLPAQGTSYARGPVTGAGHYPECERPEAFSLADVWATGCRLAWAEGGCSFCHFGACL